MRLITFFSAAAILMVAACGNDNGVGVAGAFSDTIYSPQHASFVVLANADGDKLLMPDSAAAPYARPLFVGSGEAPEGSESIAPLVNRIVCMSSTHVAMLSALGMADKVVGVSGLRFISDPEIRKLQPADVGPVENVDYELLLSLNPDLVMLYGIGGASPMESKLRELGVPYVYINEFTENSPLGKAEWLVAVAEICGRAEQGRSLYGDVSRRYEKLKAESDSSGIRPKVMTNTPYNGVWFMPSGNSYLVRLIEDAGGEYIYPNSNRQSEPLDLEEAYMLASKADVWINVDGVSSISLLKKQLPEFSDVNAVENGRVWASDKRSTDGGGNDFYESSVIYPDRVLSDLRIIFKGGNPDSTTYYRPLR